jgi:hypothetical protein
MRNLLPFVLLIALVMAGIAGCPKTRITDIPPNIAEKQLQTWYAATGAVKTIAQTTNGLTDAVIAAHTLIPDDDYQKILLALGKAAQAGIHVDSILKKVPNNFGKETKEQILAEIQPVIVEIQKADLEGLFSKSQSPELQAELSVLKTLTEAAWLLSSLAQ